MDEFKRRPPITTEKDLEAVKQKLIDQIEEAKRLFSVNPNQSELLTCEAGLKCITELIEARRKKRA